MNQAIRGAWVVAVTMFALVLGSLTYVQFFQAAELTANPWNNRQLYQDFGRQRGAILVDGRAVAQSVPSNDQFNYQRVYGEPERYAHLTGFYSLSIGSTQLEDAESEILAGTSSSLFYDRVVSLFSGAEPGGASVELTIDPQLQQLASDLIPEGQRGSIVVMEPSTGNILAMVSKPTYDPNLLSGHDTSIVAENLAALTEQPGLSVYTNPATESLIAPGSVFKLIDAAAALESGEYDAESEIPNPPALEFPGIEYTLPNFVSGGCASRATADLEFALEQSCNTAFAQLALDLGEEALRKQAERFGFGEELSIPTRVLASIFPTDLTDPELAQSAVGQFDTRVTPLQMAMVAAAIANDGEQMKPQLVSSIRAADLELIDSPQPETLRQSVSRETADQLTQWMVNVVDNGTAAGAQVAGVKVAGKTGTAEVTDSGDNAWFTGFAPADDPQVAISIVMENVDIPTGQQLTSPSAKRLIEAVLNR